MSLVQRRTYWENHTLLLPLKGHRNYDDKTIHTTFHRGDDPKA